MKVNYDKCFTHDLKKIKSNNLKEKLLKIISELKASDNILDIKNVKKLKSSNQNLYRIRINDYKLSFKKADNIITLIRILPRKDMYKYFP